MATERPVRICLVTGEADTRRCGVADYTGHLAFHLNRTTDLTCEIRAFRRVDQTPTEAGRRLLVQLLQDPPDIVHFQWPSRAYEGVVSVFLWPLTLKMARRIHGRRPKVVMTFHESTTPTLAWSLRYGMALLGADGVIRVSEGVRMARCHWWAARRVPSTVIPIASNIPWADNSPEPLPTAVTDLRLSVRYFLMFFGLVTPEKHIEQMIELIRQSPDVGLAIVGSSRPNDPYPDELRDRIVQLRLEPRVLMTGWLPDSVVSRLLQAADAVILPTVRPNSGAYQAALLHGRPVLTVQAPPHFESTCSANVVGTVAEAKERGLDVLLSRARPRPHPAASSPNWDQIAALHKHFYEDILA
jgi:glycosyltransferase involved in cell wall biosynthesis